MTKRAAPPVKPIAVRTDRAAAMLDLSPATFRRLVDAGRLPPPVMFGRIPLWSVAALAAAIDSHAAPRDGQRDDNPWLS